MRSGTRRLWLSIPEYHMICRIITMRVHFFWQTCWELSAFAAVDLVGCGSHRRCKANFIVQHLSSCFCVRLVDNYTCGMALNVYKVVTKWCEALKENNILLTIILWEPFFLIKIFFVCKTKTERYKFYVCISIRMFYLIVRKNVSSDPKGFTFLSNYFLKFKKLSNYPLRLHHYQITLYVSLLLSF